MLLSPMVHQRTTPDTPELYTVAQAAALFHVHERTVRRWINAGSISYWVLPSGVYRIPAEAIESLKSGRKEEE